MMKTTKRMLAKAERWAALGVDSGDLVRALGLVEVLARDPAFRAELDAALSQGAARFRADLSRWAQAAAVDRGASTGLQDAARAWLATTSTPGDHAQEVAATQASLDDLAAARALQRAEP